MAASIRSAAVDGEPDRHQDRGRERRPPAPARRRQGTRPGTGDRRPPRPALAGDPATAPATKATHNQIGREDQRREAQAIDPREARAGATATTRRQEVGVGLAMKDGSPTRLRFRGADPCGKRHRVIQVERRRGRNPHHLAGAVEPERIAEAAVRRPGRSDDRAGVVLRRGVRRPCPGPRVELVRRHEARDLGPMPADPGGVDISVRSSEGSRARS